MAMATGVEVLRVNQWGAEGATHGTAVPADVRLLANIELPESDREWKIPSVGIGKRVPELINATYVQRIAAEGVRLTTPDGLYYQILPQIFSSCVKGNITPAEQSVGEGDYLWAFTDNLTGDEDLETFTLETGDGVAANEAIEIAYCLIPDIEITGNAETGECTLSATINGDAILPTTLSTVATMPTFTAVLGKMFQLDVDDAWASLGTTPFTDALVDFVLRINGGAHHKRRGSANLKPDAHGQGKIGISLTLGLERTAAVIAEAQKYFTETRDDRHLRLEIDSGVIIGAGVNHKLTIDLAGIWTAWHAMGKDQDGNNLDVATFTCGYESTGLHAFDIDLITDVAAL